MNITSRHTVTIFVLTFAFSAQISRLHSQQWNSAALAQVDTASNWTPATVPGPGDSVTFVTGLNGDAQVNALSFPGGIWQIADLTLTTASGTQAIIAGPPASGTSTLYITGNLNQSSTGSGILTIRSSGQLMNLQVDGDIILNGGTNSRLDFGTQSSASTGAARINNVTVGGNTVVNAGTILRINQIEGTVDLGDVTLDGTLNPIAGNVTSTNGTLNGGTNIVNMNSLSGSGTITGNKNFATLPTTGIISVNGSSSTTFSGIIENGAFANNFTGLTKNGTGTLTLTGNNTFTATTTINDGVLQLNGAGNIGSSVLSFGITDTTNGTLRINNGYTFSGTLDLDLLSVTTPVNSWTLFDGTGFGPGDITLAGITTNIIGLSFTETGGIWTGIDPLNRTWIFNSNTGILTVPEPSTWALLAALLAAALAIRKFRTKTKQG